MAAFRALKKYSARLHGMNCECSVQLLPEKPSDGELERCMNLICCWTMQRINPFPELKRNAQTIGWQAERVCAESRGPLGSERVVLTAGVLLTRKPQRWTSFNHGGKFLQNFTSEHKAYQTVLPKFIWTLLSRSVWQSANTCVTIHHSPV